MGIINVTPDSFSGDGILHFAKEGSFVDYALEKARYFVEQGASIIDVGGESTRPGAPFVPLQEELDRVLPVIEAIKKKMDVYISIDTTKAEVAEKAMDLGVELINDVSGLMTHPQMIEVAKKYQPYVVITHSYQHMVTEQRDEGGRYLTKDVANIVQEIIHDLEKLALYGISHGLKRERIIIDPGIGYGKTISQNMMLLKNVRQLSTLGYPVLMGVSRKSFIGFATNASVANRLGGSIAANVLAVWEGANIIRVHDVAETSQAIKLIEAIRNLDHIEKN